MTKAETSVSASRIMLNDDDSGWDGDDKWHKTTCVLIRSDVATTMRVSK